MFGLIVSRLAGGVIVVACAATLSFLVLRAAPGGPFDEERTLPDAVKANIEARYRLDRPLWSQYTHYMLGLVRGDLGYSMKRAQSVREIVAEHVGKTVLLGFFGVLFAAVFGVLLGVVAARRHNTWLDHGAMSAALLGISIPSFVLGPLLILAFSLQLGWLPPARFEGVRSWILPAATLGMIYAGVIARLTRDGFLETLRRDYIRTARAKGLSERSVTWKHAARLGLLPVLTYLGPAAAALLSGSFVVEKIFQIPGLGFYFVASISDRDYPVLSGLLVFYAALLVTLNFLVDLGYGLLDPRIRRQP